MVIQPTCEVVVYVVILTLSEGLIFIQSIYIDLIIIIFYSTNLCGVSPHPG
jgi:hypothetical protein